MCIYNTISSHTDHFGIQSDSEVSLLTFVNLFPRNQLGPLKMQTKIN